MQTFETSATDGFTCVTPAATLRHSPLERVPTYSYVCKLYVHERADAQGNTHVLVRRMHHTPGLPVQVVYKAVIHEVWSAGQLSAAALVW
eukprot:CAMPEP_0115872908 /NCGR_PEP_ID=MMETSP0287-20121206/23690_1 /TAXON_ID=412157 /ORGANISM="Chrysochromulina rotalis, Strain UIO044" /LENGTH=89 /DNA_ID=CAMNT_0003327887 /DNA_START=105 /DNA_END=374 /DNA_ORIENTATION=-